LERGELTRGPLEDTTVLALTGPAEQ